MTGADSASATSDGPPTSWPPGHQVQHLVVDALTRTQIVQYAGASGDFNPIHTDEVFATKVAGRPSVIGHGMLTMGLVGKAVAETVDQEAIKAFGGRFKAPVLPGDSITVTITAAPVDGADLPPGPSYELLVVAHNQSGAEVFSGQVTVNR